MATTRVPWYYSVKYSTSCSAEHEQVSDGGRADAWMGARQTVYEARETLHVGRARLAKRLQGVRVAAEQLCLMLVEVA